MNAKVYIDGKFVMEVEPLILEGPTYTIVSHDLVDYPVRILSEDGERFVLMTAKVWRVCTNDYCFTAMFPTKEAAEMSIPSPITFRWLGESGRYRSNGV